MDRLVKFHGVSKEKFRLYLKETVCKYHNRHQKNFLLLVDKLSDLVPNLL